MKWYVVNKKYVNYLQKFDNRIENIDYNDSIKPYLGIVFQINNLDYYVPISSEKRKYYNMRENIDFIKIDELNNLTNTYKIYGALNLNNMIPILDKDKILLNYNDIDKFIVFQTPTEKFNYIGLLQKELSIINSKSKQILKSANELYIHKSRKPNTSISKRTINFDIIESKCIEWNIIQNTLPTLKNIKQEDDLFYIYDNLNDKNKFDKVVKMIDNNFLVFNKDIKLLDIKDLENKRFLSIDELAVTIDLKAKELNIDGGEITIPDISMLIKDELPFMEETKYCFDGLKITKPFTETEINNIKDHFIKYFRLDEEAISKDMEEQENEDENSLEESEEEEKENLKEIQNKLDDILDYIKNKAVEDVSELSDKTKADDMISLVVSSELDKFRLATSLKLEDVALAISIPNTNTLSEDELWEEIKDELYNKAIVELKGEIKEDLEPEDNNRDNLSKTSEETEVKNNEEEEE